jgi:FHA domain-containing protein
MDLVIRAHSKQDEGVQQTLVGHFDARGGTIGRSETNTLTLPDPKRHISRLQAEVVFREGGYLLRNVGSGNALLIGGRPVNPGEGTPLTDGDELVIGGYVLRVALIGPGDTTQADARRVMDPRSVIRASVGESKTDPRLRAAGATSASSTPSTPSTPAAPSPPAASPPSAPAWPRTAAPAGAANPFADLLGAEGASSAADPFADLLAPAPPQPPARPAPPRPASAGASPPAALPEDFDPFADLPSPSLPARQGGDAPRASGAAALPTSLDLGDLLGPGASESAPAALDRAFGLDAAQAGAADPLAAFLAAPPPDAPGGRALDTDPMAHFDPTMSPEPPSTVPAAFDHTPQLQAAYAPPAVHFPESPRAVHFNESPPAVYPGDTPPAAHANHPPVARHNPAAAMRPTVADAAAPESRSLPATGGAERAAGPAADTAALWAAFCEGARIAPGAPQPVDAALMRLLGQLLFESVDGSLKLMAARAAVKQELRAEVTVIQTRNNNPMKFSPEAATAIEQMLRPPLRGFMPGPAAVHDAMTDLLGHAIGTMAGMRAALQGVLQRFEPTQLEAKLGSHKMMDAVLPMNRRAKLWEMYLLHFAGIRAEAHDEFHELFGKAFVQAYEEQLAQLKSNTAP